MATASKMNISPSKILLPLSFASMFGGVCTLLGTSTNILVSSIAQKNGLEPFSMFEFAPLGIILMAAGFIYLFIVGIKIVPPRRKLEDLTKNFRMNEYLADVQINGNFQYIGKPLSEVEQFWRMNIDVIRVYREDSEIPDYRVTPLQENDVLRIRGNAKEIDKLIRSRPGLDVKPAKDWGDVDLTRGHYALVEAVIAPDSDYDSRTVESIDFFENYGAVVLGIYKQGKPERENLDQIRLRGGDSLLLTLGKDRVPNLRNDKNFVIVSDIVLEHFNRKKIPYALTILGGVVLTAALNIAPIVLSAATGVILMIFTGCLKTRDIYRSINWKVIFLLAGVIPLGIAMQKTGAAQILSNFIVDSLGHLGPRAVLSGYFLMTMLLTAMISNQATAAILASIAIETAGVLGVHPKPFLMAITFAASLSFITPWSHQANTLVYGPGQFKFTDFTKVGIPLNLILWVLATIFIPVFWNF
jgi:di/tricarboxylate transporter